MTKPQSHKARDALNSACGKYQCAWNPCARYSLILISALTFLFPASASKAAGSTAAPRSVYAEPATTANTEYDLTDAPTITVDWSKGTLQTVVLGGNRKVLFINGYPGMRGTLAISQDGTGSRLMTWPADAHWPGAVSSPPTLTTTAHKTDYIGVVYNGRRKSYDMLGLASNYP